MVGDFGAEVRRRLRAAGCSFKRPVKGGFLEHFPMGMTLTPHPRLRHPDESRGPSLAWKPASNEDVARSDGFRLSPE